MTNVLSKWLLGIWQKLKCNMARFYLIGKISAELMKRMQNDPSADRYASTKKVTEAAGLKLISYEWVRGRFDVISCVEGDYEQALALKIAFKNSGLMDDLMVHEVIDYNKAFENAADATKSVIKPGE